MFKNILLSSMLLSLSLSANWLGDDYHAWVSGEALLLRPTVPDNYYTILGPSIDLNSFEGPFGRHVTYCPSYKWGYRVEVGIRSCSNDLRVDWTSLNTSFHRSISAAPGFSIWTELSSPSVANNNQLLEGSARVIDSHRYSAINGDAGHWMCSKDSCLAARLFGGLRYARFEVDRIVQYRRSNGQIEVLVRQNSDSQGIGPRFGLAADYTICWGIHLTGQLAGSLLIGSTKGRYNSDNFQPVTDLASRVRNDAGCEIIPSADMKFGFGYAMCLCSIAVRGDIGYQLDYFSSGVQRFQFWDVSVGGVSAGNASRSKAYALDGWYFRLGAEY